MKIYTNELGHMTNMATNPIYGKNLKNLLHQRSGGSVVDNTLDYQSRGRKIDPPLLRSFG